jgi:hypothetical protein
VHERERSPVRGAGLLDAVEAAQELRPRCVQVVVLVEVEPFDEREAALDLPCLGQRRRLVQLDDGRARDAGELPVERGELRPVLRLVDVQRRDRRLHDVDAAAAERESALERGSPLRDLLEVPQRPILVSQ